VCHITEINSSSHRHQPTQCEGTRLVDLLFFLEFKGSTSVASSLVMLTILDRSANVIQLKALSAMLLYKDSKIHDPNRSHMVPS